MKKIVSIFLASTILTSSLTGFAEPILRTPKDYSVQTSLVIPSPPLQPGERDPGDVIYPMKRYDKAPFSGVLLSPKATAKIIADFDLALKRIEIEKTKEVAEVTAKCTLDKDNLNAAIERLNEEKRIITETKDGQINDLLKQVKSDNSFFSSAAFTILVGGLSAVGGFYVGYLAFHNK